MRVKQILSRAVLPKRSILVRQKLLENAKIKKIELYFLVIWVQSVTRKVNFIREKLVENAKIKKIELYFLVIWVQSVTRKVNFDRKNWWKMPSCHKFK